MGLGAMKRMRQQIPKRHALKRKPGAALSSVPAAAGIEGEAKE